MKKSAKSYTMALGGILAALAVVIMCLGGMIPLSTFVCPLFCMLILSLFFQRSNRRAALAWYMAVSILSVLLGPDKEAAAVFLFLGYYPILKPYLDRLKIRWLLKILYFNSTIAVMYYLLLKLFKLEQIVQEYEQLGTAMTAVMFLLGNLTFVLLDIVLDKFQRRWKK